MPAAHLLARHLQLRQANSLTAFVLFPGDFAGSEQSGTIPNFASTGKALVARRNENISARQKSHRGRGSAP